jgi:hypothetical protein
MHDSVSHHDEPIPPAVLPTIGLKKEKQPTNTQMCALTSSPSRSTVDGGGSKVYPFSAVSRFRNTGHIVVPTRAPPAPPLTSVRGAGDKTFGTFGSQMRGSTSSNHKSIPLLTPPTLGLRMER